jgi:hypothetical protein
MGPEISFRSFARASGRGLGPGNREFFGSCVPVYIKLPMHLFFKVPVHNDF